jgi:predicted outer membrane repeat protein
MLLSTFVVVDLGDAGRGTGLAGDLRYCIDSANANGDLSNHIVFQPGLTGTISLGQGQLSVGKNLEIDGPGADLLTISGNHQSGVFEITSDPRARDFRLSGVTAADGTGVFDGDFRGGGLYNRHADLTLTNCVFTRNALAGFHAFGGALVSLDGSVVLTNCIITDNHVNGQTTAGGGLAIVRGRMTLNHCIISGNSVEGQGSEGGGVVSSAGVLTATDTTVTGNTARLGGGIRGPLSTWIRCTITHNVALSGGGVYDGGTFIDSTIADNVATTGEGGGFAYHGHLTLIRCTVTGNVAGLNGGGLRWVDGLVSITDSTFSGNNAIDGGAIYMVASTQRSSLELTRSTITQNTAVVAGGLDVTRPDVLTIVRDTILAGNQATTARANDVRATVLSLGYNLVGQVDDSTGWQETDLTGTSASPLDPRLGPLQDNGGPTLTHAPFADSPAIDNGDPLHFVSADQRGTLRGFGHPRRGPDIGAVDVQDAVALRVIVPDHVMAGQAFALTVVALDMWGNAATNYGGTVHFDSTDLGAELPADYPFAGADQGAHTFMVTMNTPGAQHVRVKDVDEPTLLGEADVQVGADAAILSSLARALDAMGIRKQEQGVP